MLNKEIECGGQSWNKKSWLEVKDNADKNDDLIGVKGMVWLVPGAYAWWEGTRLWGISRESQEGIVMD